ncbi:MAG: hypothetical protein QOI61_460 [Actinomycetota bacterium]|jgi:hypothetical protein
MGKASQAKKVNRAAATGGGRTAGKKTPVAWYSSLFVVVVLGVMGVFIASKNLDNSQKGALDTPPVANKDHWHAAYGFNLCGKWAEPLSDGPAGDTTGIHTHADGLVHTHPFLSSVAGKNATFGKLMDDTDTTVTATSVNLKREGQKFKNGDKCGKTAGVLTARVFKNLADKTGKELKGNPSSWRIVNGSLISISFNPKGFKLTQPPSASNINDPGDLGEAPAPTPATEVTEVTQPPAEETPTSEP